MNFSNAVYSTIFISNQKNENIKRQIEICCTWGEQLLDGVLTYQIKNAKPELKDVVRSAINYWDHNIKEITIKEISGKDIPDIIISFGSDNGKIAGQTITNFDSNGFIQNNKIFLAEKAFTKKLTSELIEYLAKHEFGHALGIGHANFNESLMSPLVYHIFNEISDCEINAIKVANEWKLIDNDSTPKKSKIDNYYC